jgi:hypothetical protein
MDTDINSKLNPAGNIAHDVLSSNTSQKFLKNNGGGGISGFGGGGFF